MRKMKTWNSAKPRATIFVALIAGAWMLRAAQDNAPGVRLKIERMPGRPDQKNLVFSPVFPDHTYTVTSTTNLSNPAWTALSNFSLSDHGQERTIADLSVNLAQKFYRVEIGSALIEGQDNSPIPTLAKPAKGAAFTDPVYKTTLVRATDHAADGVSGFARNDYARRQAFNADTSRFLVSALDGSWHIYDARNFARVKELSGVAGDAEPQWHPTNPDLLYHLPNNGGTVLS